MRGAKVDYLEDPTTLPMWVLMCGIGIILLALVWIGFWLARYYSLNLGKLRAVNLRDLTPDAILEYLQRIQDTETKFAKNEIDIRELHLDIAALLREVATERSRIDVKVLTIARIEKAFGSWPLFVDSIKSCENPSFSNDPKADARRTIAMARQVVNS